jgi:hypothetical protein
VDDIKIEIFVGIRTLKEHQPRLIRKITFVIFSLPLAANVEPSLVIMHNFLMAWDTETSTHGQNPMQH